MPAPSPSARLWPLLLLLIVALGAAWRLAAAQGGLWLDEAWSAVFARDVATPAGVFLNIHHDNNHHLNTLWLQLVGIDATPIAQRGLSIVTGTLAIIVATLIVAPRGRAVALATAALFALAPMLVTYGSEARGYAPMTLCLLIAIWIVGRWLDAPERPVPALGLAAVVVLGLLSQLTMLFGLFALAGWVAWRRGAVAGAVRGLGDTARLIGPAMIAALLTAGAVLWWLPGMAGFQFGNYQTFTLADWSAGLRDMLGYGTGLFLPVPLALATLVTLVGAILWQGGPRAPFYLLAIAGLPLGVALVQLGNPGIPRYYLLSAIAILLFAGEALGATLARPGRSRLAGILALGLLLIGSVREDIRIVQDRRADTGAAIAAMHARAPGGATVTLDRPRASAVVEVGAARLAYPVRITPCGRFLFVDRDGEEPFPTRPSLCGAQYRPIAGGIAFGLSGTHWRLYERALTP
ncbi:hypothetical protein [Sphingomonas sp.]|uniref:hypothetical protein n=1 Tax=Sphingomonas sp. TaxID=28214 RepID=UPI002DD6A045|nr:hypothetical protein [Sphingomonas sp.]